VIVPLGAAAACALAVAAGNVSAQQLDRAAWRTRLGESRPLGPTEIDQLLDAARLAAGGRAFHLTAERGGFASDIVVERDGHVHYIRSQSPSGEAFTEFTGRIARYCDGTVASGEMVIEYRHTEAGWEAEARPSSPADLLRPIFDMLVGLKPLVDAGVTSDGGRALAAAWNLNARGPSPGGGGARGASMFVLADPTVSGVETLVIDPLSLLPARWEFAFSPAMPSKEAVTASYRFAFDPTLVLAPPATSAPVPGCADRSKSLSPR
jgi:hypothetical protein